ncbi:amino acid permease-domain-containing protein [Lipomyces oligophaga]|uniref:amino acid permease-domain-containing protein n=1 Tax=Lipomyces oligophaga TaxID=45792 RepID=UPI0034CD498D
MTDPLADTPLLQHENQESVEENRNVDHPLVPTATATTTGTSLSRRTTREDMASIEGEDFIAMDTELGEALAGVPSHSGQPKLGVTSAIFLILNKMIGTGIFSTPSGVFLAVGSVGWSIMIWVIGGILSLTGLSVFLEFGLAIPKNGGEKNYLERVYRKPKYLITCIFLGQMILLGFSAGNSLAFGRYLLFAAGVDFPSERASRIVAVLCITGVVLIHGLHPSAGTALFNGLGIFKVFLLIVVVIVGVFAVFGWLPIEDPGNFEDMFSNAGFGGGAYNYATGLLRVVYSYRGWENANYVLSELENPRRTLAVAAPLAIGGVTILYVLANVAYFAVIPKVEIAHSGVIVAGLFFRRVFGDSAGARLLPFFVALSNLGNVLVVSFAHARVNCEFGKEGILPYSKFFATVNWVGAPVAGLFLHWIVTCLVLTVPPAGEAYEFIIDLNTYPSAWINALVAGGLVYLQYSKKEQWSSPFRSYLPITLAYLFSNFFLMYLPLVKPPGTNSHPGITIAIFGMGCLAMGAVYWVVWSKIMPWLGNYEIVDERTQDADGNENIKYVRVPKEGALEI